MSFYSYAVVHQSSLWRGIINAEELKYKDQLYLYVLEKDWIVGIVRRGLETFKGVRELLNC